jgi:hypothetical protein
MASLADLGVSGPGEKRNKWAPFSGGGQGGFARRAHFLGFQLQNFIFLIIFILLPIHISALHVGTTLFN